MNWLLIIISCSFDIFMNAIDKRYTVRVKSYCMIVVDMVGIYCCVSCSDAAVLVQ